jgi:hypothetical protein
MRGAEGTLSPNPEPRNDETGASRKRGSGSVLSQSTGQVPDWKSAFVNTGAGSPSLI